MDENEEIIEFNYRKPQKNISPLETEQHPHFDALHERVERAISHHRLFRDAARKLRPNNKVTPEMVADAMHALLVRSESQRKNSSID